MRDACPLFLEFRDALNAELVTLGCHLQVAAEHAAENEEILLLNADGSQLGWLPDHVDATSIAAFEQILKRLRPE